MKNPASYIRQKFGQLLDGIIYDDGDGFNAQVPVVASEGTEDKYQIFIGEYSDADRSNSHEWGANASQVVEVVAAQPTAAKKHVDAIGEMVTDIIHPTPQSKELNSDDFHIIVNRPSINHIVENAGDGTKIVRLILRYDLIIYHN